MHCYSVYKLKEIKIKNIRNIGSEGKSDKSLFVKSKVLKFFNYDIDSSK